MILATNLQAFEREISYFLRVKDLIIVEQAQDNIINIYDNIGLEAPHNDMIFVYSSDFSKDVKHIFGEWMPTRFKNYNAMVAYIRKLKKTLMGSRNTFLKVQETKLEMKILELIPQLSYKPTKLINNTLHSSEPSKSMASCYIVSCLIQEP